MREKEVAVSRLRDREVEKRDIGGRLVGGEIDRARIEEDDGDKGGRRSSNGGRVLHDSRP